jgi:ribonuclease BN (tRNA processing enzyme)
MELVVLGCHAGMPTEGRASSGYLVAGPAGRVLLDCGPGVATALSAHGTDRLDGIVVSHLHPDHCYDLLPVGTTLLRSRRSRPLPLYAPRGARAMLAGLGRLFPLRRGGGDAVAFHHAFVIEEYEPGDRIELGGYALSLPEMSHAVPTCGVRIGDGSATLAYTADTGPAGSLRELAEGADLLLSEATLATPEAGDYGHLCAAEAARVAAEAGAGRLVLTHLGSTDPEWVRARRNEALRVFDGPVDIARPGARHHIRRP